MLNINLAFCKVQAHVYPFHHFFVEMAGRRVIKGYLKDDAKVVALSKKAMKTIKERFVEDVDISNVEKPNSINSFLEPILCKMMEVKNRHNNGENVLENYLQHLTDMQVQALKELLSTTKRSGYSEERIVQCAFIMIDELNTLQNGILHLQHVKAEMLFLFTNCFAKSFNEKKGAECVFACDKFKDKVLELQNYRNAVRRTLERADVPEPEVDEQNRCLIM